MTAVGDLHVHLADFHPIDVIGWAADDVQDFAADADILDIAEAYDRLQQLDAAIKVLQGAKTDYQNRIAERIPAKDFELPSGQIIEKRRSKTLKGWDNEALVRCVLDSRRITEDGEIIDETPVEKLRTVFRIDGNAARLTELRARGIDETEFCTIEWGQWKVGPKR